MLGCGGGGSIATSNSTNTTPPSPSSPPPASGLTASLQASSSTLSAPGPVTLTWTTSGAITVSIDQGIGSVSLSGSKTVSVTASTAWTLTAKDASGNVATAKASVTMTPPAGLGHVVVVIFENEGYNAVFGSPAAPLINQLAAQYSVATNFYANDHPSLKDYFMLTT